MSETCMYCAEWRSDVNSLMAENADLRSRLEKAERDTATLKMAGDRYVSAIWTGNVRDVLYSWADELSAKKC